MNKQDLCIGAVNRATIDLLYSGLRRIPAPGEEESTSQFQAALGGGPIAALATAARLGARTRLATCLTDDLMARLTRELLEREHIVYRSFGEQAARKSAVNISSVITFAQGDRSFISYFTDEDTLTPCEDEIFSYLRDCAFCIASEPMPALFAQLRDAGSRIAYDVGWSETLSLDSLRAVLPLIDIFTPNEKEAMKITGCGSPAEALAALATYVSLPVVKIGREGCLIWQNGQAVQVLPSPFAAVDTTGAGDAFLGGLVFGLSLGWDVYRAARLANYTGGNAATAIGCLTAPVDRAAALKFAEGP